MMCTQNICIVFQSKTYPTLTFSSGTFFGSARVAGEIAIKSVALMPQEHAYTYSCS